MASADEQRPGVRPRRTLGRRLDIAARYAFPTTCTMLLMLLTRAPLGLSGQAVLLPAVALSSVWFWSVFRPTGMPPPAVFLIGVLYDLLGWQPIGTGVLVLLLLHGAALRARRPLATGGFLLIWLGFAAAATAAAALEWALTCLLTWRLLPPAPAIFQAVLSASIYPALAIVFARAHRSVANPERA
ncbi:MAG TPA: rod shape-determining protein MreD [Acetobacteraceae bacterium]|jgi:rod shape-determining protein MreD